MTTALPPKVWLGDDGILRVDFGYRPQIGLADVQSVYQQHLTIGIHPVPVLTMGEGVMAATPEAEHYANTPEIARMITADAYIVRSPLARLAFNFYMRYRKPPYPCRAFDSEASALVWLAAYQAAR